MSKWADESKSAQRARWLAELADAIDQAQRLLWALAGSDHTNPETRALYGQLESVRGEIAFLRRGASAQDDEQLDEIGDWLGSLARDKNDRRG